MITAKTCGQEVKNIVEKLIPLDRSEARHTATVKRPWGTYKSIEQGIQYQVKHISVKPGACLSLQYHHYRSEHWVVVEGIAEVLVGERTLLVGPNESVYINKGEVHRLTNIGNKTLHLIEVQCGKYLGEDDIVRLEDKYGRVVEDTEMPKNMTNIV